jgi:leader peptidase (prepilin peptidase)/N-methyltransferase
VLLIHLLFFGVLISWRDFKEHLISKRVTHLALITLIPLLENSILETASLSLANFTFYFILKVVSPRAIGSGDVRLSILIGCYVSAFGGSFSDLILSNTISWLTCCFAVILLALKRQHLRGIRVAFAPYLFMGLLAM